jgi:hypothetical protein
MVASAGFGESESLVGESLAASMTEPLSSPGPAEVVALASNLRENAAFDDMWPESYYALGICGGAGARVSVIRREAAESRAPLRRVLAC